MKKFVLACALGIAIPGATTAAPFRMEDATCVLNKSPGPIVSTETDQVHVVVNGISYAIPRNYFRYEATGCGAEQQSFLLQAFTSDFSGATPEMITEFRRGWGRTVSVLLKFVQAAELEGIMGIWTHQVRLSNGEHSPLAVSVVWDNIETYGLQHGSYRSIGISGETDVYVERNSEKTKKSHQM
jgi:hypothetical protein